MCSHIMPSSVASSGGQQVTISHSVVKTVGQWKPSLLCGRARQLRGVRSINIIAQPRDFTVRMACVAPLPHCVGTWSIAQGL